MLPRTRLNSGASVGSYSRSEDVLSSAMNTPRTKPLRRYSTEGRTFDLAMPDGRYAHALIATKHLLEVGRVTTLWPRVEEAMIRVTASLLGDDMASSPARQVFRSVVSTEARIGIMRSLLEEARINAAKGRFYDDIIDEFASINKMRNKYVHGLWTTNVDKVTVYLSETTTEEDAGIFSKPRLVPLSEVQGVVDRCGKLIGRVLLELEKHHPQQSGPENCLRQTPQPSHCLSGGGVLGQNFRPRLNHLRSDLNLSAGLSGPI